jgi:hypothetical protein
VVSSQVSLHGTPYIGKRYLNEKVKAKTLMVKILNKMEEFMHAHMG